MKQKIAIFGYSSYRKNLYQMISQFYPDKFEITAVFDRDWKMLTSESIKIEDPLNIFEMHTKGLFSSVVVCEFDQNEALKIKKALNEAGISVIQISENVFLDSSSFSVASQDDQPDLPEGYRHLVLRNIYGADCGIYHSLFMFDKEKNLNSDYFYNYQLKEMNLQSYPIPYGKQDMENAVFMAGEYCMLAKIYNTNYWHFTFEALDQIYLLEKHGFSGKYILQHTKFAEELMQLLGIDSHTKIIWTKDLPANQVFQFEFMHLYTIAGIKLRKSAPVLCEYSDYLTKKLNSISQPDPGKYPQKLFVKRIGNRKLIVGDNWLEQHGFQTIIPEELTVEQQIRYFMNAKIILSPHGANSTNAVYMKPGTVFIETFPDTYYNALYFEVLYTKHISYLPVVQSPMFFDSQKDYDRNIDYRISGHTLENAVRIAEKILSI